MLYDLMACYVILGHAVADDGGVWVAVAVRFCVGGDGQAAADAALHSFGV